MGRRKNNPELVQELLDGLWDMDNDEFDEKYYSLSSSDRSKVSNAIYEMRGPHDDEDMDDYDMDGDECISVDDAALIWMSNGKDEDYMFGYTEEELKRAL